MTTASDKRPPRGRAGEMVLAVVVIAWVALAVWYFGPRPEPGRAAGAPEAPVAAMPAGAGAETAPAGAAPRAQGPGLVSPLAPLFASSPRSVVASGESDDPPEIFIARLEALYRQRGFTELVWDAVTPRSLPQVPKKMTEAPETKLYWKLACPSQAIVGAGSDADVTSGASDTRVGMYLTVTSERPGGCRWQTFLYEPPDKNALTNFTLDPKADAPGLDAPGVPRMPGSRRVFSMTPPTGGSHGVVAIYTAEGSLAEVRRYYTQAMVDQAWSLSRLPTLQAAEFGEGIFCYTQGERLVTLFINQKDPKEPVAVIVNYR